MTPIKNTTPVSSPQQEVPAAPKKRDRASFDNHSVSGVRRNLMEDFGNEPKRVKLTFEGTITLLRSKDIPNAAFGQRWGE